MNIGTVFCNADYLSKGHYIALPVVAWDVVVETARIPSNYFPELIVKILSVGDKSIKEIHELTNLDEDLIFHILNYDLKDVVLKSIDKWHLKENTSSLTIDVVKTRVTVLQSMITGQLIPHPVYRNALSALDYDINENNRIIINGGSKGKPSTISPYIISLGPLEMPNITEKDIDEMWEEYENNDSEIAISDFVGVKSEYIEPPERILSISRRSMDENTIDYLLVKVNTYGNDELYDCQDLLEPTTDISMDFLTHELKICIDNDERVGVFLGLKEIEVPLELKDIVGNTYPNFPDEVVNEICRFFALKDIVDENAKDEYRLDDVMLSRCQSLYESLLRKRDVFLHKDGALSDGIILLLDDINNRRLRIKDVLQDGLRRKNLVLDNDSLVKLYSSNIWKDVEKEKASLKSLILRHLLAYFYANHNDAWFVTQLVNKEMFSDTMKFILDSSQIRNGYQHFNEDRSRISCYNDFFATVDNQLKIFNEVYNVKA